MIRMFLHIVGPQGQKRNVVLHVIVQCSIGDSRYVRNHGISDVPASNGFQLFPIFQYPRQFFGMTQSIEYVGIIDRQYQVAAFDIEYKEIFFRLRGNFHKILHRPQGFYVPKDLLALFFCLFYPTHCGSNILRLYFLHLRLMVGIPNVIVTVMNDVHLIMPMGLNVQMKQLQRS